jgi:hypothetical protein
MTVIQGISTPSFRQNLIPAWAAYSNLTVAAPGVFPEHRCRKMAFIADATTSNVDAPPLVQNDASLLHDTWRRIFITDNALGNGIPSFNAFGSSWLHIPSSDLRIALRG